MSKRFGRNQRRKMREQLALQDAIMREHARTAGELAIQLSRERASANKLGEQLRVAKACLGQNHPAFPAGCFDPGFKPHPEDGLRIWGSDGQPCDAMVMRFARVTRDEYRRQVHIKLYAGKECFGYALSEDALHRVPREELAEAMTRELVELLLNTMRKGDPDGR